MLPQPNPEAGHLEAAAFSFAVAAHADQTRLYTLEPYIWHPVRVAERVRSVGGDDVAIATALLHDVLEDVMGNSHEAIATLRGVVGADVTVRVVWLTKPTEGSRATRHKAYCDKLVISPPGISNIKLADMLDNFPSIAKYARHAFVQLYREECRILAKRLTFGHYELSAELAKVLA